MLRQPITVKALFCWISLWILMLGTMCCARIPVLAQAGRADLDWGVNGHPLVSYPGVTIEQQLDYVADLGMVSYRVDIGRVEQAAGLARLIQAGKARGIAILPVVVPALNLDSENVEDLYAKSWRLAFELGSQFKNDVRVWELGNELENYAIIRPCEMQDDGVQYNCGWGPAGGVGPLEYYGPRWAKVSAVLKGLSEGIAAVDPSLRKAIGTAGWGHVGAFERMQADGIQWDISVWHMYGEDPEWAFQALAKFNRPIWVTEFNNPRGGEAGEDRQAEGLAFAVARLRQLRSAYNIEAAHVYELMDETYWAPDFEAVMGLVRLEGDAQRGWRPGAPKPAYRTMKELIASKQRPIDLDDCHLNQHNRLNSHRSMQLSYSYCLLLGRPIDGQGLQDWTAALRGGGRLADVLAAIIRSDEFRGKHATSTMNSSQYVAFLYRRLLNREPDVQGLNSYSSQIESGALSREKVAEAMLMSEEFARRHSILRWPAGGN